MLGTSGDLAGARGLLVTSADTARLRGYFATEAWLLHDTVRLGDATSVAGRLAELAEHCEGDLVASYAAHAAASVRGRPQELVDVVDRFEAMGTFLLAAEVATEAAQAFQGGGDRRSSAALGVRAASLAAQCEGARTPGLAVPVMVAPLTPRERDVASLAARGASSREIADRLYLSVRTVNNHLQSVYSKLGISGRRELANALAEL